MQQNEYLLAKIGVDTAENEPLQVWGMIQFNIHFTPSGVSREVLALPFGTQQILAVQSLQLN